VGNASNVKGQKVMPDELKQIAETKIGQRSYELVAA
jgi:hypothetical protein